MAKRNKQFPGIGSVSYGSMLAEDINPILANVCKVMGVKFPTGGDDYDIMSDAMDAISASPLVPDYIYFGSHPGDGSDLGFWVDWDSIDEAVYSGELVKVDDPADVPQRGSAIFVSDHGNLSFYHNGKLVWDCV